MSAPLRPLTLGELLDRTFALYRSNFLLFMGIVALPQLLTLAANLWRVLLGGRSAGPVAALLFMVETLAITLLSVLVMAIAQGAVVIAVSHLHLGRPASIADSYSALKGRMGRLCITSLWVGFLEGIGFLLLIVPGVLMALRWALVIPAMAIEDLTIGDAMTRSSSLTEGHRGRIFMVAVLYGVVFYGLLVTAVGTVAWLTSSAPAASVQSQILEHVTSFVTQCLVGPLITIALSLVYYDERVRKEAFDIEHMITDLDTAAPVATTA